MSKKEGYTTITMDFPIELLKQLDEYCDKYYMATRSTAIKLAVKKMIDEDSKNDSWIMWL